MLLERCTCGSRRWTPWEGPSKGFALATCSTCGITRQIVDMSSSQLAEWYSAYGKSCYTHDRKQDLATARKRMSSCRLPSRGRLLDIGAGNMAFVDVCRERGLEAVGCDISDLPGEHPWCYHKTVENIHFPTDHFDFVTGHDVIEHLPDPVCTLKEIRRILKRDGKLILEIPAYWEKGGGRHWKPVEHLWYWTPGQLEWLLKEIGFVSVKTKLNKWGKVVATAKAPKETRPTILIPPGIGDTYWPLVKMKGFCDKMGYDIPDVKACWMTGTHKRSYPFLTNCAHIHCAGYAEVERGDPLWDEAYRRKGNTRFDNVLGVDHFLAYNGILRFGCSLEVVDPQWPCDWFFPQFVSLEQERARTGAVKKFGQYVVGYFLNHGMYQKWLADFGVHSIHETMKLVSERLGAKIILVGAEWDERNVASQLVEMDVGGIYASLVGRTTLDQLWGVMRGAACVVGFPSGATIVPTAFRVPTIGLWHNFFDPRFWVNAYPPQALGNWYEPLDISSTSPEQIAERADYISRWPQEQLEKDHETTPIQAAYNTAASISSVLSTTAKPKVKGELQIACVYKTGGDFNPDYVYRLFSMAQRVFGAGSFRFTCLTDDASLVLGARARCVPFEKEWPGWWNKMELFRPGLFPEDDLVVYFDLDTVLVGGISDPRAQCNGGFYMLKGFKPSTEKRRASGVMLWRGDRSKIWERAVEREQTIKKNPQTWDQSHIASVVREDYGEEIRVIQDRLWNVASFKNNCRGLRRYPKHAQVICFHGYPRPHELSRTGWLKELWR